eukprot:20557_6
MRLSRAQMYQRSPSCTRDKLRAQQRLVESMYSVDTRQNHGLEPTTQSAARTQLAVARVSHRATGGTLVLQVRTARDTANADAARPRVVVTALRRAPQVPVRQPIACAVPTTHVKSSARMLQILLRNYL